MKHVEFWYYEIEHTNGKREIIAYGDETKFTREVATQAVKNLCKERGWKFIGIHLN